MTKKTDQSATIHVVARAPFHAYYDGEALSLSATNRIGDFSILPGHADFFSMLTKGTVEIIDETSTTSFEIEHGLLTVKDNSVYLFVNV